MSVQPAETNRDAWVYNYSAVQLREQCQANDRFLQRADVFSTGVCSQGRSSALVNGYRRRSLVATRRKISWSRSLMSKLRPGVPRLSYGEDLISVGAYRPFNRQFCLLRPRLNHEPAQLRQIFPTPDAQNIRFLRDRDWRDKPFSVFATDLIPDLACWRIEQRASSSRATRSANP